MRVFASLLLVCAVGLGAAWWFTQSSESSASGAMARRALTAVTQSLPQTQPSATSGAARHRKCVSGQKVLYTDEPCPSGYKSAQVEGNVTVVHIQASQAPAAAASSPIPNARQLLAPTDDGAFRERALERAAGQ